MTNSNSKMTQLEIVSMMLADENIQANAIYVEYLEGRKASLLKKRDNKKATKTQVENEGYKTIILDVLENANVGLTITELQSRNDELDELSNQKVSALMKQLKDNGLVEKSVVKGKSYFSLA